MYLWLSSNHLELELHSAVSYPIRVLGTKLGVLWKSKCSHPLSHILQPLGLSLKNYMEHRTQLDQPEAPGIRKGSSTSVSSSSSYGMLTSRSAALTSFFTFSGKGDKFTWVHFHTPCFPPKENNQCTPKMRVNHSITNGD